MTEATHFSQCVHDQQRRLEAEDCDSIRCAQLISGGRRRIRPPCTVPRSRSPTMCCIRLVRYGYSWGEPERAPHSRYLHHFFMSCTRPTSVDPIAYNRISTWKTGILRARAGNYAAPRARALDPAGLRANCASGLDTPCSVHERCPSIYAG